MADSTNLYNEFIGLTSQSARFRRVILHVHSPQSHDFAEDPICDPVLNNREQFFASKGEELFLSHIGDAVDLIAITDHMRSGYACQLSKWVIDNKHTVKVLPGIELNIRLQAPLNQLKLHTVVIFPENKSIGEIERIIPNGNIPSDDKRTGKEILEIDDLPDFIRKIQNDHSGICIAAHIDNKNGVRYLFRQTGKETISLFNPTGEISKDDERVISEAFKDFLINANFDGIEISRPEDRIHYTWESKNLEGVLYRTPVFLTFDSHNIEALKALKAEKKERITYIKMPTVSWQGLKDAIQFPDTRIRFSDDRVPPPYIIGIQIMSPSTQGFFSDLKLGFVENLNCLIGARGSGKSTVIDAIRYVFGYNRTLDELGSNDLKKAVKDRQKATLNDTIIKVAYQVNERDIHLLEAVYGGEKADYVTKVFDINGNNIPVVDVERSEKYPLRLFGWSEIETLGRDPQRQMDLLDKLVEGIKEFIDKREKIYSSLRENTKSIQAQTQKVIEIYESNDQEIKLYQENKGEFERYNTKEVEILFESLDRTRDQKALLEELRGTILIFQNDIRQLTFVEFEKKLQDDFERSTVLKAWWESIKDSSLKFTDSQKSLSDNLSTISQTISALINSIDSLILALNISIDTLNTKIRENVSVDPERQVLADLRSQAKERLERIENLREEYNENFAELERLLAQREGILDNLIAIQTRITELRQAKKDDIEHRLNEFQTEEMKVEIRLIPNGNKIQFEKKLQELKYLSEAHIQFKAKKWPELIAEKLTPTEFVKHILDSNSEPFVANKSVDGKEYAISTENAQAICENLLPFKDDLAAQVKEINADKLYALLAIEEVEWDDKVSILRNGQPVENASPGQRSSAMLPLIALAETVPLIIDQPEDNLDNRLVGKVLVDILAKLKEKRQIIVCTHNPNIVVLGDAEQVIVLDAIDNNHGHVDGVQASIAHPNIIKKVVDLMEGGKDAFDTRRKRYGR